MNLFLAPPRGCALTSDGLTAFYTELLCSREPAFAAQSNGGLIPAVIRLLFDLASRDPHNMNRVTDDIGGALLTLGSLRHELRLRQ